MATARVRCTEALQEIGVLDEAEGMSGPQGALALRYLQRQIDAWAADRLTLSRQLRTPFTLASGSASVTLGPSPSTVVMVAPMFLNHATYLVPGASPAVEAPIAVLDDDQFAALSVKALSSSLPTACFYQVNLVGGVGTLTVYPVVNQAVSMVLYTPEAVGVPASLNTDLTGPAGYDEAFHYQLSLRLCGPFGVNIAEQCPQLPQLTIDATKVMKRPNVQPGILGLDPAITRGARRGGYDALTDQ